MGKVQIWEQLIIFAGNPGSQIETSHLTGYPPLVRPLLRPACLSFASYAIPVPTRSYTALCRYTRPVSSPCLRLRSRYRSARPNFLSGLQLAPTLRRTRGETAVSILCSPLAHRLLSFPRNILCTGPMAVVALSSAGAAAAADAVTNPLPPAAAPTLTSPTLNMSCLALALDLVLDMDSSPDLHEKNAQPPLILTGMYKECPCLVHQLHFHRYLEAKGNPEADAAVTCTSTLDLVAELEIDLSYPPNLLDLDSRLGYYTTQVMGFDCMFLFLPARPVSLANFCTFCPRRCVVVWTAGRGAKYSPFPPSSNVRFLHAAPLVRRHYVGLS